MLKSIDRDIKKMEGKIDIAFVGDSITARWGNGENWRKHGGTYRAVNMGIGGTAHRTSSGGFKTAT